MAHKILESTKLLLERRWVSHILVIAALGLTLLVVGNIVHSHWSEFESFSWQLRQWPLAGAGVALIAAFGLNALTWYSISHTFGSRVGFWKDLEIYSFSTAIRRIPGAVWQLAGRTYMYYQAETALSVPLWGTLWEIAVQISSGILLTVLMFLVSPQLQHSFPAWSCGLLLLLPVGWLALRPQDLILLVKRMAPRLTSEPNVSWYRVSTWIGLYTLIWSLAGIILYCILCALGPQNRSLLPVSVGLVSGSSVMAVLVSPIPGGLGIREISLVLLLQMYVESPVAVIATVLLRLTSLVGEALVALLVFLAARGRTWLAQRDRNSP